MMWDQIKGSLDKVAATKKESEDPKKDLLQDIKSAKIYFGNVLNSSTITGYMEEYLFRGLKKLMDVEDGIKKI